MLDRIANQGKRLLFYLILAITVLLCLVNIGAAVVGLGVFWLEVASSIAFGIFSIELCGLIKDNG